MERRRTIAGSPVRSASVTWASASGLIVATLSSSGQISDVDVAAECAAAAPTMELLIANDYLADERLTLVAAPVHLHILVATGTAAFDAEGDERLEAVPGGTTATGWRVYVDPPSSLKALVEDGLAGVQHFATGKAPAPDEAAKSASSVAIDLTAFERLEVR